MTTEHQPNPTYRELLRRYRLDAGLTQEELAEKAGLSARGISDLERGVRGYPHPDTVRRLASALNLDEDTRAAFVRAAPHSPGRFVAVPDAERQTFPVALTPLIGREAEAETVSRWFLQDGHRLVTLHGPGGMGKTRLAVMIAERMVGVFRDGQVFVDLAPLRDAALLPNQIVAALGLREQPGQSLRETLAAFLRPRQMLVVLDNFEHLLPAAPVVSDLLRVAPDLRLLVTSRSPLRVQGERLFQAPPLGRLDAGGHDLDSAVANDAVKLFVVRAQAAQADFALTEDNVETVLAICLRLEGLPLALELAAARIRIFSPEALLHRLSTSLSLLTSGPRDAPLRHRTLRDAIAWSDDLLEPPVQALFHRLGIFVGGWSLEAAEAVAASDGATDVVEGLAVLVDLNLIRATVSEAEPRFTMLETIREFARERLAMSPDAEVIARAHAEYFGDLAARGAQQLTGSSQGAWLRRLDAETPNLRAALQHIAADAAGYLRFASNLGDYWFRRSRFAEGAGHLAAALAHATTPSPTRASALHWMGAMAFGRAEFDVADQWLAQCETLARSLDAASLVYDALFWRGVVADQLGDTTQAGVFYESALAVARELGDAKGIGSALNAVCLFELHRGAADVADLRAREAIPYLLSSGDAFELSVGNANLGEIALVRGDLARATRAFQDALSHARSSDVTWLLANALVGFAALAAANAQFETAATLLGAVDSVRTESLHIKVPSHVLHMATTRQVRANVSEAAFLQAWEAGRALTWGEVLERIQIAAPPA